MHVCVCIHDCRTKYLITHNLSLSLSLCLSLPLSVSPYLSLSLPVLLCLFQDPSPAHKRIKCVMPHTCVHIISLSLSICLFDTQKQTHNTDTCVRIISLSLSLAVSVSVSVSLSQDASPTHIKMRCITPHMYTHDLSGSVDMSL